MASRSVVGKALVAMGGFTALTAVGGGIALVVGVEGERFATELLEGTPFNSYVVPGLILAGAVGGTAGAATLLTLRGDRLGTRASALAGLVLLGWIGGEALLLPPPARSWWEATYAAVGLGMVVLGLTNDQVCWR